MRRAGEEADHADDGAEDGQVGERRVVQPVLEDLGLKVHAEKADDARAKAERRAEPRAEHVDLDQAVTRLVEQQVGQTLLHPPDRTANQPAKMRRTAGTAQAGGTAQARWRGAPAG